MLASTATTAQQMGQGQQATRSIIAHTSTNLAAAGKNHQMHAPATEAEKAAIQQRLKMYPHQPDMDTGHTMYR
jgi:hypothetical protein